MLIDKRDALMCAAGSGVCTAGKIKGRQRQAIAYCRGGCRTPSDVNHDLRGLALCSVVTSIWQRLCVRACGHLIHAPTFWLVVVGEGHGGRSPAHIDPNSATEEQRGYQTEDDREN